MAPRGHLTDRCRIEERTNDKYAIRGSQGLGKACGQVRAKHAHPFDLAALRALPCQLRKLSANAFSRSGRDAGSGSQDFTGSCKSVDRLALTIGSAHKDQSSFPIEGAGEIAAAQPNTPLRIGIVVSVPKT